YVPHRSGYPRYLHPLPTRRSSDLVDKLVTATVATPHVAEATVISTCNRLEIYAEVERFHGTVEALSRLLCGLAPDEPIAPELLRSEEHTSELQSRENLVCRLLLEK